MKEGLDLTDSNAHDTYLEYAFACKEELKARDKQLEDLSLALSKKESEAKESSLAMKALKEELSRTMASLQTPAAKKKRKNKGNTTPSPIRRMIAAEKAGEKVDWRKQAEDACILRDSEESRRKKVTKANKGLKTEIEHLKAEVERLKKDLATRPSSSEDQSRIQHLELHLRSCRQELDTREQELREIQDRHTFSRMVFADKFGTWARTRVIAERVLTTEDLLEAAKNQPKMQNARYQRYFDKIDEANRRYQTLEDHVKNMTEELKGLILPKADPSPATKAYMNLESDLIDTRADIALGATEDFLAKIDEKRASSSKGKEPEVPAEEEATSPSKEAESPSSEESDDEDEDE